MIYILFGMGLADRHGIGILAVHWQIVLKLTETVCDVFALDCHRISTASSVVGMDWQRIGTGLTLDRHRLELS